VTVSEGTNDLHVIDIASERDILDHKGIPNSTQLPKEIYLSRDYSFRHAKEDTYMFWRKNNCTVALLDKVQLNVLKEFPEIGDTKGYLLHICVTNSLNKIYGYNSNGKIDFLRLIELDGSLNVEKQHNIKIESSSQWAGMEMTTISNILVAAVLMNNGTTNQFLKLSAFSTVEPNLSKEYTGLVVKDPDMKNALLFRKVKGYDIFLTSSLSNILAAGFDGNTFYPLHKISNIYSSRITGLALHGDWILSFAKESDSNIKLIKLNIDDYSESVSKISSRLNSLIVSDRNEADIFAKCQIKSILIPKLLGKKKIDITKDGLNLYIGSSYGLHHLRRSGVDTSFELTKSLSVNELSLFALKVSLSGNIIVQECNTNNLIVFNSQLEKITTLEGVSDISKTKSNISREPHFGNDQDKIIWFSGGTLITEIHLRDLSAVLHSDLGYNTGDAYPNFAIADFERRKFLVSFNVENQTILSYQEGFRSADNHILEEVFPFCDRIESLNLTKDNLFGIIGGSGINEQSSRSPCLGIYRFDKTLEVIAANFIQNSFCSIITCVTLSPTKDDLLFVGTDGPLLILKYSIFEQSIRVLKAINLKSSGKKSNNLGQIYDIIAIRNEIILTRDNNSTDEKSTILTIKFLSSI